MDRKPERDDGTKLALSWAEARRALDAFNRAVLVRDLRKLGWDGAYARHEDK